MSTSLSLDCTPEYSQISCGDNQELLVNARLTACALPVDDTADRAPLSVTAVVDRSGSMSGSKLEMVKETLNFVTRQLKPSDKLGLVVYDDTVTESFPLTSMDEQGRKMALDRISAVQVGGCTNLAGGLYKGLEQQIAAQQASGGIFNKLKSLWGSSSATEPSAPPQHDIDLQIGNLHLAAPGAETHNWTMFVQGVNTSQDLTPYIKSVTFKFDQASTPNEVTVSAPPFETAQSGSETFPVGVTIKLTEAYGSTEMHFTHDLSFEGSMNASVKTIEVLQTQSKKRRKSSKSTKNVHSVWLFTDGLVNAGDTDPKVITNKTQALLKSSAQPVSVHTFGYGDSHNAELLRNIAEVGHGMYYYVQNAEQIGEAFVECLGGLLSVVAQKLDIKLKGLPGSEIVRVFTHFNSTKTDNGYNISIADMFAEEHRDLLCKVKVNSLPTAIDTADILSVEVTYNNALTSGKETVSAKCTIQRPQEATALGKQLVPDIVDQQRNRVETMQAFEEARAAADCGDLEGARSRLVACKEAVQRTTTGRTSYCADLCEDMEEALDGFASHSVYSSRGQKAMFQAECMWNTERAAGKAKPRFATSRQAAMKSAFSGH